MVEKGSIPIEDREYIHTGREVVVTGIGTINPLGLNVEETWGNMLAGKSGVEVYPTQHPTIRVAAPVKGFRPEDYFQERVLKDIRKGRLHRVDQLALAAAMEGLKNAGLLDDEGRIPLTEQELERVAISIGSFMAGTAHIIKTHDVLLEISKDEQQGIKTSRISPGDTLQTFFDHAAGLISKNLGVRGPRETVVAACATGNLAVINAARMLALGEADVVIAIGVDAVLIPEVFFGISKLGALAESTIIKKGETIELPPEAISRPFDQDARGFVIGEGAGVLILEEANHARAREVKPLVQIVGYYSGGEAYHETAPHPDGEGEVRAMRAALARAKLRPSDLDAIFVHGTGTSVGDPIEAEAILELYELYGEDPINAVVVPTKDKVGHLIGAAASYAQVAAIMAMQENRLPPAINLENPIAGVRTEASPFGEEATSLYIPTKVVQRPINNVMVTAYGFYGALSAVVFSRYKDEV